MTVESVRLSSHFGPRLGMEAPTIRSVMAVCSDDAAALRGEEERVYLLLEGDRRVFEESEQRAEDVELLVDEIRRMQETEVQAFLKTISAQQLPLGVLLRLIPQVLLYYLYDRQTDFQEISRRRNMLLEKARHHWETALAKTGYRRQVLLNEIRHGQNLALEEARLRRGVNLAEARLRRNLALEEARLRRNLALEEARRRRNLAIEEARRRRDVAIEEARRRRNLAIEDTRHRRNMVLAEIHHRRNVTLEHIIHRRNIIRGNMRVIRQKGPRGLAKGAVRRLSGLYRRLREGQKP
jgi:hypothetical protein